MNSRLHGVAAPGDVPVVADEGEVGGERVVVRCARVEHDEWHARVPKVPMGPGSAQCVGRR